MSDSREGSPDWLRCFQAPTEALTLSSDSEPSPNDSPFREDTIDHEKPSLLQTSQFLEKDKDQDIVLSDRGAESPFNQTSKAKSPKKRLKVEAHIPTKKKKVNNRKKREGNGGDGKVAKEEIAGKNIESHTPDHSVWMLSSDSESGPDNSAIRDDNIHHEEPSAHKTSHFPEKKMDKDALLIDSGGESPFNEASKEKSPKKRLKVEDDTPMKKKKVDNHTRRKGNGSDVEVAEDETSEKHIEPHGSSSRLPLVLSEKVHRSKALVECEGDSIDLSGDMGAVGRIVVSDTPSGNHELFLDLKGTIYKTAIVPSRTFCIVSFGPSEAKIEAIMNDFIQLKPQANVYEAETMVEGTLDGFSFDSEDEADKMPKAINRQTDQNEGTEEQTNGKTKRKAEKTSGVVRKKGKTAGGKPLKKVRRKSQVPKKTKTKK